MSPRMKSKRQKVKVDGLVKRNPSKMENVRKAMPAFCQGLIFGGRFYKQTMLVASYLKL